MGEPDEEDEERRILTKLGNMIRLVDSLAGVLLDLVNEHETDDDQPLTQDQLATVKQYDAAPWGKKNQIALDQGATDRTIRRWRKRAKEAGQL